MCKSVQLEAKKVKEGIVFSLPSKWINADVMSSMLWSISTAQRIKCKLEMHQNFRVPQFDYSIMILYDCTVQQYCLHGVMQALWSASPDVMHRHCRVHQLPRIERRTSAVGRGFFSCEHQTDFMSYFQNMGLSRRKFSIGITSQTRKVVQSWAKN